mmetsp:Transcript_39872/g.124674  ORF Transcript_39872/g.124674 Transcript_39872/m.124674 type:complete len:320 (-) Transcript_39872:366-1325(-)|eukprot:CAMPEP_0118869150 /NCGR_PEP_ID=MMETSP1163-20130328/12585_1 /TAXON_ID=124430 /ORGANISM="Phaeomonas parva, Strain CCMP2877" /LENGTH=319 /DNA_ID=CAMNT_0006804027 /DNA_START=238 /DNA_END=1197 /DNA_ORIENTATION=+
MPVGMQMSRRASAGRLRRVLAMMRARGLSRSAPMLGAPGFLLHPPASAGRAARYLRSGISFLDEAKWHSRLQRLSLEYQSAVAAAVERRKRWRGAGVASVGSDAAAPTFDAAAAATAVGGNDVRYHFFTVPNVLTGMRILATPIVGGLILQDRIGEALVGVALMGVSDWLDGYIAKTWNQQSIVGKFLDPMADKIMMTTLSLSLAAQGYLPGSLVAIIVGRDAVLVAGTIWYRLKTMPRGGGFWDPKTVSVEANPSLVSKVNTGLQVGALAFALSRALWGFPGDAAFNALCLATGTTTIWSGMDYAVSASGMRKLKRPL